MIPESKLPAVVSRLARVRRSEPAGTFIFGVCPVESERRHVVKLTRHVSGLVSVECEQRHTEAEIISSLGSTRAIYG